MIDLNALMKVEYGLFCLTAKDGEKDNGCIINTFSQLTVTPCQVAVTVNKDNLTHDIIVKNKNFNVTILTQGTPFSIFKHFGYQSGRVCDKFETQNATRSENGLLYLHEHANAFVSGKVIQVIDLGTHSLFIAEVTEAKILNDDKSVNYSYYFEHIKENKAVTAKSGWRCKICNYVYEGDDLPADFVCPLCKHGAADFEKI